MATVFTKSTRQFSFCSAITRNVQWLAKVFEHWLLDYEFLCYFIFLWNELKKRNLHGSLSLPKIMTSISLSISYIFFYIICISWSFTFWNFFKWNLPNNSFFLLKITTSVPLCIFYIVLYIIRILWVFALWNFCKWNLYSA